MRWTEFRLQARSTCLACKSLSRSPFVFTNSQFRILISDQLCFSQNIQNYQQSNNFVKIQDYSELEIRENMWWTDSVVHQKSCEHRLFQLLSKHYFKRFKTRLLLHPSSVAQNHSPYWWCHIPKRKKLWKENFFLINPNIFTKFLSNFLLFANYSMKISSKRNVKNNFFVGNPSFCEILGIIQIKYCAAQTFAILVVPFPKKKKRNRKLFEEEKEKT